MNKLQDALSKQKKLLESQGYSVAYICLYGSQNYGLELHTEDYQSDIDMKAIIVPTLDDLIKNSKPVSTVVNTEWGQCDIKDIRTYFQTLLKASPAYIETLFTDYYIVDEKFVKEFNDIFELRESLVNTLSAQMIRAMYGMMCEKQKALCHPYPSIAHKIEKFGYDGKQAHHVLRMWIMMVDFYLVKEKTMKDCFTPNKYLVKELMNLKTNSTPLEKALTRVENIMINAKEFKDSVLGDIDESKVNYSVKGKFLSLSQEIIKSKITDEILKGEK